MPVAVAKPPVDATKGAAFPYGAPVKPIGTTAAKPAATAAAPAAAAPATATKSLTRQKYDPTKCANPFQTDARKCKTQFSQSYVSGSIPCRLQSSGSKHYLQWDEYAQTGFSPDLLVVCCDGLCEDVHPFTLMAPMMIDELVARSEGNAGLFAPVLEGLVANLRKALMHEPAFGKALHALQRILLSTDALLLPYLPKLVPCLAKGMRDKTHRDAVLATLGLMEQQCGPDARKVIKAKIPTY